MQATKPRSPLAREGTDTIADQGVGTEAVRAALLQVSEILRAAHRTPDLGNKVDPLDELLYLLITQRTRIDLARKVYAEFRREFYPWQKVLRPENLTRLKRVLSKGGRGDLRQRAVRDLLGEVSSRTGSLSLDFLRQYTLEDAEEFLLSLPWVGRKTALCVLMYSLGHPVFPADSNIIRIFRRTRLLGAAGVSLKKVDHRVAQKRIVSLIPPEVAYSLHVNMVVHGRQVCLERNPKCGICPVRLFCACYRDARRKEASRYRLTMVDLFCGAGGISYGFASAGIRPLLAVDRDAASCRTYRVNVPWMNPRNILNADVTSMKRKEIRELLADKKVDFLVAGVPCQGFSKVGLKSKPALRKKRPPEKEAINRLFMEVIRWTEVLRPRIVLLENVPAMGSSKILFEDSNVGVRELLEKNFGRLGYSTSAVYLNSADFGLPQVRRRLFFVAARRKTLVENLEKRLLEFWNVPDGTARTERPVPVTATLEGLPSLEPGKGAFVLSTSAGYPRGPSLRTRYHRFVYDNPYVVLNHVARNHNADDMLIISSLQPGESYKNLVLRKPDVIARRTRKVYSLENFHDKFYRLGPERPCRTIVSHLAKDGNSFIHPFEDRSITVREAARSQGFPDSFVFTGSRMAQFTQVGNAVPPLLAQTLAAFLIRDLEGK